MVDKKVIEAFHIMWDSFPGSVRLIHKNHTVLAANEIASKAGFDVETLCFKVGTPESHRGCKANLALSTKTGQAVRSSDGKIRYWLPVKDCNDVYVHVTLDTNVAN